VTRNERQPLTVGTVTIGQSLELPGGLRLEDVRGSARGRLPGPRDGELRCVPGVERHYTGVPQHCLLERVPACWSSSPDPDAPGLGELLSNPSRGGVDFQSDPGGGVAGSSGQFADPGSRRGQRLA
jgi:hypothetical protein